MRTLEIENSAIHVGESYQNLNKYLPEKQVIMITDENVYSCYKDFLAAYNPIIISTGEKIKTWETVDFIVGQLLEKCG